MESATRGASTTRQLWVDPNEANRSRSSSVRGRQQRRHDGSKSNNEGRSGQRKNATTDKNSGRSSKDKESQHTTGNSFVILKPQRESQDHHDKSNSQRTGVPVILGRHSRASKEETLASTSSLSRDVSTVHSGDIETPESMEQLIRRMFPTPPPESNGSRFKIVDEKYKFHASEEIIKRLSRHPGCFVVGVIGRRGAGKSSVLSSLTSNPNPNLFPLADPVLKQQHRHETNGIDMHISSEGVILLDTQPVLSMSILDRYDRVPSQYQHDRHLWMEVLSAQLALFMFAVCHVVIVVSDGPSDKGLWKFIKSVESLKVHLFESASTNSAVSSSQSPVPESSRKQPKRENSSTTVCGSPSSSSSSPSAFQPHLIYVGNDIPLSHFCPLKYCESMRAFSKFFSTSVLQLNSNLSVGDLAIPDLPEYIRSHFMARCEDQTKIEQFLRTNYMLFPNAREVGALFESDTKNMEEDLAIDFGCSYTTLRTQFRRRLYGIFREATSSSSNKPVESSTTENAPKYQRAFLLSQEAWFRSAARTWDGLSSIDFGALYEEQCRSTSGRNSSLRE